jgi:hypothetical protein
MTYEAIEARREAYEGMVETTLNYADLSIEYAYATRYMKDEEQ